MVYRDLQLDDLQLDGPRTPASSRHRDTMADRQESPPSFGRSITAPLRIGVPESPHREEHELQQLERRSLAVGKEKPLRVDSPKAQGDSKPKTPNVAFLRKVVKAQQAASAIKNLQQDSEEKKQEAEEKKKPAPPPQKPPDPVVPALLTKGNLFLGEELMHLPIFHCCSPKLMNEITNIAQTQAYGPGVTLIEQGTVGSSLIVVLRGTLHIIVDGFKVQRLINGQYFGETIMLGVEDHWRATLKSESSITVCEIRREAFFKVLRQHPSEKRYFDTVKEKHRNVEYLWAGTLEHPVELFKGLSERLRRCIDTQLVRRLYFPTEKIVTEGCPGDELFLLVRGKASIDIAGRTVRIERRDSGSGNHFEHVGSALQTEEDVEDSLSNVVQPVTPRQASIPSPSPHHENDQNVTQTPVCFGELGLLGLQSVRSATVCAQTICQVRVLYRETFLQSLEDHGESLQSMASFFEKRYNTSMAGNSRKLSEVAIFQEVGCSVDFLNFLAQHLEDRMYLEGQRIIDQALPDDRCMYLISSGTVDVIKDGAQINQLGAGSVVGEITVLGLASKRSCTVVAAETCYTQVLHQSIVVRGLELFPDERQKVLMMAFKKAGLSDDADDNPGGGDVADDRKVGRLFSQGGTHRAFMKVLKASPLFANTSSAFVDEISNAAIDRIYMPQDLIIEQGLKGDSMFIMVSGQAGVFVTEGEITPSYNESEQSGRTDALEVQPAKIKDWERVRMLRVGTLHAGSISGELSMLGVSTIRSATIEAETICSMWEITQEKALAILDRFPDAQKHFSHLIVKHLERTVPARILSLQLFKGFDRKFRTLLGLYCERTVLFPGQLIAREGQNGQDLYIINMGRASLEKKGVAIKTYSSGNTFGCSVMLGIHKVYLGTLVVIQTCHVLVVTRAHYLQALDHYPSQSSSNELKRSEKVAAEELKKAIQRISARKLIWKRYQGMINPEANESSEKTITSAELLAKAYGGWKQAVVDIRQRRRRRDRELAQYRQMMEGWVTKKREALERAKEKQLMDWRVQKDVSRCIETEKMQRTPKTPPVPEKVATVTPDSAQLIDLLKEWPTPRQSPFYSLRVWDVLAEHIDSPGQDSTILPLLVAPPNSAATNQEGPLCTTPSKQDGYRQSVNYGQSPGCIHRTSTFGRAKTEPIQVGALSDSGSTSDEEEKEQLRSQCRPESNIRRAVGSFCHLAADESEHIPRPTSVASRPSRKSLASRKSTGEIGRHSVLDMTTITKHKQSTMSEAEVALAKAEALHEEVSPRFSVVDVRVPAHKARTFRRAQTFTC